MRIQLFKIIKNLNNPEDIWADYFQNQTDDCVRALTFLTVYNSGKISEDQLRRSYNTFLKIHNVNLGDYTDKSFESVRKLATKSLLNRNRIDTDKFEYVLFNPSITDFVLGSYSDESDLVSNIIKSLETETSIDYLQILIGSKKISSSTAQRIQENLFDFFFDRKLNEEYWDFLILLSYLDFFNEKLNKRIEQFLKTLINADNPSGKRTWELLMILTEIEPKTEFTDFSFLLGFIEDISDEDTLRELLNFIDAFNIEDEHILLQAETLVSDYLGNIIDNNDLDVDYSKHIIGYHYPEGYPEYDIDINGIESEIQESLDYYLDGFNESVLEKIDFDLSRYVSNLDVEHMAMKFFESYEPDDYEDDYSGGDYSDSSYEDDIDAIFERS